MTMTEHLETVRALEEQKRMDEVYASRLAARAERRPIDPTAAAVRQLIRDLDDGRATGTLFTYGQVQERLRLILAALEVTL